MVEFIKPSDLPAAATVFVDDALVVDNAGLVQKASPVQIVNAGSPVATEAQALAGDDNSTRMTPLRVKQVLDASGGGGGGAETTHFNSRALAQAATIPGSVTRITVQHAGAVLEYVRSLNTAALTTAGSAFWKPAESATPLHWGAMGDGVTDDVIPVQGMINYYCSTGSKADIFGGPNRIQFNGDGRTYAISSPVYIGNVGNGAGGLMRAVFTDFRFLAISGSWTGTVPSGISGLSTTQISRQMLVIAWRTTVAYSDTSFSLYDVVFENLRLDANFLTGCLHLENTNSFAFRGIRVSRPGKGRIGIDTPIGGRGTTPMGVRVGNGACMVTDLIVGGIEEESGMSYPPGETIETMNTMCIRWQTSDAIFSNLILNGCTHGLVFDNCGAVQVNSIHPWSRTVELRENARNIWFSNCYFDYTLVTVTGAFNHAFTGCHWPITDEDRDYGLTLVATLPDTTGDKFVLSGCSFLNEGEIRFATSGAGTWVPDEDRKIVMEGCHFDIPPDIEWRHKDILQIGVDNDLAHNSRTGNGWFRSYGSFLQLGADRTTNAFCGLQMFNAPGTAVSTSQFTQNAGGTLFITNNSEGSSTTFVNNSDGLGVSSLEIKDKDPVTGRYNIIANADLSIEGVSAAGDINANGTKIDIGAGRSAVGTAAVNFMAESGSTAPDGSLSLSGSSNVMTLANGITTGTTVFQNTGSSGGAVTVLSLRGRTSGDATPLASVTGNLNVSGRVTATGGVTSSGSVSVTGGITATGSVTSNGYALGGVGTIGAGISIDAIGYVTSTAGANFKSLLMNGGINFNPIETYRVTGLANPISGTHAATKSYVDSAVSDVRAKKNVEDIQDGWGLEYLRGLTPKAYEFRCAIKDEQYGKTFGLIAQDIAESHPQVVRQRGKEEIYDVIPVYDENGETDVTASAVIPDALGIDYQILVIPMIHAINELRAQIEELKAQK